MKTKMADRKRKIYFDSRQTDLISKTCAYSTIFKHSNAEYTKEIAETCLDSKTSKKPPTIYRISYRQSSKYYFSIEAYNPFTSVKSS